MEKTNVRITLMKSYVRIKVRERLRIFFFWLVVIASRQ